MATWGRCCWRKICSSVFLADPWHQRDDRPVLRWVSAASAPGARRRLPWCLCCSPWKPDRGIKQDHRKGWSFVAYAYRWLFYLWGNNEITLLNERNANSRGCIPQTLNMTNRWRNGAKPPRRMVSVLEIGFITWRVSWQAVCDNLTVPMKSHFLVKNW